VDVKVVVDPVDVAYRNARTATAMIRTTITAIATPEKLLFPMFKLGSVM